MGQPLQTVKPTELYFKVAKGALYHWQAQTIIPGVSQHNGKDTYEWLIKNQITFVFNKKLKSRSEILWGASCCRKQSQSLREEIVGVGVMLGNIYNKSCYHTYTKVKYFFIRKTLIHTFNANFQYLQLSIFNPISSPLISPVFSSEA